MKLKTAQKILLVGCALMTRSLMICSVTSKAVFGCLSLVFAFIRSRFLDYLQKMFQLRTLFRPNIPSLDKGHDFRIEMPESYP